MLFLLKTHPPTLTGQKQGHNLWYFVGLPLALITAHFRHGISKLTQCHIYFHSELQSFFCQDLVLIIGKSGHCIKSSPAHPKDSQWDTLNEILLLSLLNIALGYTVDFLQFDFTRHLSDLRSWSHKIYFRPHFFLRDNGSPPSFQVLIMHWAGAIIWPLIFNSCGSVF